MQEATVYMIKNSFQLKDNKAMLKVFEAITLMPFLYTSPTAVSAFGLRKKNLVSSTAAKALCDCVL